MATVENIVGARPAGNQHLNGYCRPVGCPPTGSAPPMVGSAQQLRQELDDTDDHVDLHAQHLLPTMDLGTRPDPDQSSFVPPQILVAESKKDNEFPVSQLKEETGNRQ
ncbi:MAG TPA: hypothetical protein VG756_19370 [Pseudonocardiaceae bacterium]|nr:hypothetical protein [Pseudonocardiaceae bacterium]